MRADLSCKQFVDFIDEYLSGGLLSVVRSEFDRHMALCPSCVEYLRTYQTTIELVRTAAPGDELDHSAEAPEDLIQASLAARCL